MLQASRMSRPLLRPLARNPRLCAAAACAAIYGSYYLLAIARYPQLHHKASLRNQFLVDRVTMFRERFYPSLLFGNGWLQLGLYLWHSRTAKLKAEKNIAIAPEPDLHPAATATSEFYETQKVVLADGGLVSLEWHHLNKGSTAVVDKANSKPQLVVLLNPTLTGDRSGYNMVDMAEAVAASGGVAVVLHRRGHRNPLQTPR